MCEYLSTHLDLSKWAENEIKAQAQMKFGLAPQVE